MFRAGAVGTVATVGTVPGGARAGASATRPAGDLVLFNGKIHTMAGRVVEVLAIHNGRIVHLTGWRYLAGTPAQNGPPFRMIVDSGIHAGMSSDGMQIAPMNPFIHAYYATTGRNALGQLINDGQQISRPELLTLYTSANGWFLGGPDKHRLGTLEEGRLGDGAVLDRDYFTVPDEALRSIRPVLTVVGGTIVHNTGEVT